MYSMNSVIMLAILIYLGGDFSYVMTLGHQVWFLTVLTAFINVTTEMCRLGQAKYIQVFKSVKFQFLS